jgi:hypothetical protein
MKTLLVLVVAGLLWSVSDSPAQPLWLRRSPHGAGCPDCAPLDDSSSVRLMAQAAPVNRGEKISGSALQPAPSVTTQTNSSSVVTPSSKGDAIVGFSVLAGYRLSLPAELESNATNGPWADAQINAMIPASVMALNHQRVAVEGFMVPLQFENGKVVSFMLSENPPACCYATMPRIHEWVEVHVKPPGVPAMDYSVVRAHGALSVGAKRDNGTLTSIYRMEADSVTEAAGE